MLDGECLLLVVGDGEAHQQRRDQLQPAAEAGTVRRLGETHASQPPEEIPAAGRIVAAADPFTTSENQVTEQAAQIQNLILQGYNAIVINAASPDALNGAVKQACDAGIIVVSFDGIVTEPCAWRIACC